MSRVIREISKINLRKTKKGGESRKPDLTAPRALLG